MRSHAFRTRGNGPFPSKVHQRRTGPADDLLDGGHTSFRGERLDVSQVGEVRPQPLGAREGSALDR